MSDRTCPCLSYGCGYLDGYRFLSAKLITLTHNRAEIQGDTWSVLQDYWEGYSHGHWHREHGSACRQACVPVQIGGAA